MRQSNRRTRRSLFEMLESRQMLTVSLDDLRPLNDTGSSATDSVTSEPQVTGAVSGEFTGYVQIDFDHFADGSVDGSLWVYPQDPQITYDPWWTGPQPSFLAGYTLGYRLIEYNSLGNVVYTSDWQAITYTIAADDYPSSARDVPGDSFLWAQSVDLAPGHSRTLGEEIGDGAYPGGDVDLFSVYVNAGQTLEADIDAHHTAWGSTLSGLDSYLRLFDASGTELAFSDNDSGRYEYYPENLDAYVSFTASTEGRYYIGVSGKGNQNYDPRIGGASFGGSTGKYLLYLKLGHPNDQQDGSSSEGYGYAYDYRSSLGERVISISNETVMEGDQIGFRITRSGLWDRTITVAYQTRDRTAVGQSPGQSTGWFDYVSGSGTLTFAPGQRYASLFFDTIPDWEQEPDEQFYVDPECLLVGVGC